MQRMPSARSAYGPIMVVRENDKTNQFSLSGIYGHILNNEILKLPKNGIFLDIGANAGIFTLVAAQHLTEGEVFSFEPNPWVFRDLIENVQLNNLNNVVALNVALGPVTELVRFSFPRSHTGRGKVGESDEAGFETTRAMQIAIKDLMMLDQLIRARSSGMKIDTEGYEHIIIKALSDAGWLEQLDFVVVEINFDNHAHFGSSVEATYSLFEKAGFRPAYGRKASGHYDEVFRKE